jgi:hypothetical protein
LFDIGDTIVSLQLQMIKILHDEIECLLEVACGARPPPDLNYSNSVKWLIGIHSRGRDWQRPSIWSSVKALFLGAPGPMIAPDGDHWVGNATRLILAFRLNRDSRLGRMVFEPHPRESCLPWDFKVFGLRTDNVLAEMGAGTYQLWAPGYQIFPLDSGMEIRGVKIDVLNNWGAENRTCVPLVQFHIPM